jgi:1-deoxy-D-xylulose-5-phosphate synthase
MNALAEWLTHSLQQLSQDGDGTDSRWPLLERVAAPADLRRLPHQSLPGLATELRDFLLDSVARSGGHLASGLGTVELAIALHRVFDTPADALVWDVGHQGYPHKVLTGRRADLPRIRQRGGISGFLRRGESQYDNFGAGHSSTSISAALGIALANQQQGLPHKSVAIIGDGALSAGLAYEALDHAGALDADLLVVLNDNGMSISPSVGAMSRYLERLVREESGGRGVRGRPPQRRVPRLLEIAERIERREQGMVVSGQWFEDLGFSYSGPVDGHDLPGLLQVLQGLRQMTGPRLLHVVTRKGEGYAPAVADPVKYHGVTKFDPQSGITAGSAGAPTFTQVFGDWLCEAAGRDDRVVGLTPAMREGSGLTGFARRFPDRYQDVGIAEQHCVTLAAGMATRGLRPVVAIYSTFLQRAYDQLIHDVALQSLPVVFAIDRAGVVGPDGATHNGSFDLSFLRCVPNLTVMAPADGAELRDMLDAALACPGPTAVRYPRAAAGAADAAPRPATRLPIGRASLCRSGAGVSMLVFGSLLPVALEVAGEIDATVVNMRFIKPLDEAMVARLAAEGRLLVTIEENAVAGGAGSAVAECLHRLGSSVPLLQIGLPDSFPEHGTRDEVLAEVGLDAKGIRAAIERRLQQLSR